MVAIPPSPQEGPFSSSHSWTTTEMKVQPVPGEAVKHRPGERGASYTPVIFYFGFKGVVGSREDHMQSISRLEAPQNLGDTLG